MGFTIGFIEMITRKERSNMTVITAEKKATEIAEKYNMGQIIPFDPVRLADLNGIEVRDAIFNSNEISGIITKKDDKITIL